MADDKVFEEFDKAAEVPAQEEDGFSNNASYLRCIVLIGLYWSWMFLHYWSDANFVTPVLDAGGEYVLRGASALGTVGILALVYILSCSKKVEHARFGVNAWRYLAIVLMPDAALYSCAMLYGVPYFPPLAIMCWFSAGVGAGLMVMLVGLKLCTLSADGAIPMIYLSIFLAVAVGVLILVSDASVVKTVAGVVLPLIAGFAFHIEERNRLAIERVLERRSTIDKALLQRDHHRLQVQMFTYSCVFAMTQYVLLNMGEGVYGISLVWVCFFFSAVAFCIYSVWMSKYVSISAAQIIFLSMVSAAIPPLAGTSSISHEVTVVCCAIVAFGFTAYECITLYSLSRTVIVQGVSFVRHFSMGRLANALGIFAGWMLAFVLHGAQGLIPARPDMLTLLSDIVIAVLVAVVLFNIRNNVVSMTVPIRAMRFESCTEVDPEKFWREACEYLEERHGLSPRERDVFRLLSKGRDSRYICNALCISMHTAKSHAYHVYRKMDIHSQQELITVVENETSERIPQAN